VGIAKNLYVGVNANVAGTLGVTGVATFSAAPIYSSLTASSAVATDASKGLVSVTNTGTGNNVLATSPTLVTPILGTPQSGTLTNATGLPLSTGVTGVLPEANGGTGTTTGYYGFKNRIINGAMVIDQRNAGASVTLDTNTRFIVDRFFAEDDSTATVTGVQSTTAPAGFINSMLFTVTTADSSITASENCNVRHWIEGLNVADLGWGTANAKTVTLSFWVRSSVIGTHSGALLNSAANRNYVFSYTISVADTWEQKSITIAGDISGTWLTTNGRGIGLFWNLGSGSTFLGTAGVWGSSVLFGATGSVQLFSTLNATFYITGVQLEKGSTATSFDYRPYGTEFSLCQRYFQKLGNASYVAIGSGFLASVNTSASGYVKYTTTMRSAPTTTFTSLVVTDRIAYDSAVSTFTPTAGTDSLYYSLTCAAGGTPLYANVLTVTSGTSGFLALSAEL
jgi:hypothetical protein